MILNDDGLLFPIYGKIKNVPNHQPVQPIVFRHPMDVALKKMSQNPR